MNPTLLFDLDGTISDPLEGVWKSLNHSLLHFGYPPLTSHQAASFIGPPLDETFALLTGTKDPDFIRKQPQRSSRG